MQHSLWTLLIACLVSSTCASAASEMGDDKRFAVTMDGETALVDATAVATHYGFEFKQPREDVATLCRETYCIPLMLNGIAHQSVDKKLWVDANAVAKAIGRHARIEKGHAHFSAKPKAADHPAELPAYNAAWGKGRGFAKGNTLPDLPLYDMTGKEVRFSQFLGTRYVIYVWASW